MHKNTIHFLFYSFKWNEKNIRVEQNIMTRRKFVFALCVPLWSIHRLKKEIDWCVCCWTKRFSSCQEKYEWRITWVTPRLVPYFNAIMQWVYKSNNMRKARSESAHSFRLWNAKGISDCCPSVSVYVYRGVPALLATSIGRRASENGKKRSIYYLLYVGCLVEKSEIAHIFKKKEGKNKPNAIFERDSNGCRSLCKFQLLNSHG